MLTFASLLGSAGVPRDRVRLIRHKDSRIRDRSLFDVWHTERNLFEAYQSVQTTRNKFDPGEIVASFVVTRTNDTVFVGLYDVVSRVPIIAGDVDPITGDLAAPDCWRHELVLNSSLIDYQARVIIQSWPDPINYVKHASRCDPEVIEIKRRALEEPYPGHLAFSRRIDEVPTLYSSWRERLSEARGVYLLRRDDDERLYVGSATGAKGFLGRWDEYASNGHGGNVRMLTLEPCGYWASILEVAGSRDTHDAISKLEDRWKRKRGTRVVGLKAN